MVLVQLVHWLNQIILEHIHYLLLDLWSQIEWRVSERVLSGSDRLVYVKLGLVVFVKAYLV